MKKKINEKPVHPKWCSYPSTAVDYNPVDSCWGVLYGLVERDGESYCKECEYHKNDKLIA